MPEECHRGPTLTSPGEPGREGRVVIGPEDRTVGVVRRGTLWRKGVLARKVWMKVAAGEVPRKVLVEGEGDRFLLQLVDVLNPGTRTGTPTDLG